MAEARPVRARQTRREPSRNAGLSTAEAAKLGLRHILELTGKDPEGVTGIKPADDGWTVSVEVLDDRRVPSSSDILSTYEAEIGPDGDLLAYRRVRRYARGRGDSGDSVA